MHPKEKNIGGNHKYFKQNNRIDLLGKIPADIGFPLPLAPQFKIDGLSLEGSTSLTEDMILVIFCD